MNGGGHGYRPRPSRHSPGADRFGGRIRESDSRVHQPSRAFIAISFVPRSIRSSTTTASVHPCLRFDIGDVVRHGEAVHRTVVDLHLPLVVVDPGERMLHPLLVIAVGEILARM